MKRCLHHSESFPLHTQVVWSCLVEDSNLFLKYFMEKLTRDNPSATFQVIFSVSSIAVSFFLSTTNFTPL